MTKPHSSHLLPTGAGASELVNVIADGTSITRRPGLVPAPEVIFPPLGHRSAPLGRVLYEVRDDGTMWALGADCVKPSLLTTPGGLFKAVTVHTDMLGEALCVIVRRDGVTRTERFSERAYLDSPADGVEIPFKHVIVPTPPSEEAECQIARLARAHFRMLDTGAMRVDTGRGLAAIPFRRFGHDNGDPRFSGDVTLRALGWKRPSTESLWRIEQDDPQPFTLLRVTTEWKEVNE